MKYTFFTPGPSQLFKTVPYYIKTAVTENILSISHRSDTFKEIFKTATNNLRMLLSIPDDYYVVFVSSGTEAMERVIENTVEKRCFHFFNGSFGQRWYEIAVELGKAPKKCEMKFGEEFPLHVSIPKTNELICFTQNETSNGSAVDLEYIYNIAKDNSQALIAVDIVSSAPYVDIDYTKLDCVFFSVQKLFGLPAGLGVIILSPKALEKAKLLQRKKINIGTYHSFPVLVEYALKNQTPETPNVMGIYLLGKILGDFLKIGITKIRQETKEKASLLYRFFDNTQEYTPFISKANRSQTVVTLNVGTGKKILTKLKAKGFILGNGYGPLKEHQIRITNFPSTSKEDIEKLLANF